MGTRTLEAAECNGTEPARWSGYLLFNKSCQTYQNVEVENSNSENLLISYYVSGIVPKALDV